MDLWAFGIIAVMQIFVMMLLVRKLRIFHDGLNLTRTNLEASKLGTDDLLKRKDELLHTLQFAKDERHGGCGSGHLCSSQGPGS